jgi:RHS repeat-associated protein
VGSRPRAEAETSSPGEGEGGNDTPAPGAPQPPPPDPTQVVEYYHLDVLGSVRAVTNEQGVVIARHDFIPFGEEIAPQYPPTERKLFTGQERDFETGLDYFNARQYRPDLGQFTAPDPMSLAPSPVGSQALGSYTYVSNSPLNLVDPSGMSPIDLGSLASFFAYLGSMFTGGTGWQTGGMPMGSIFGVSMSFSVGGSFGSGEPQIPAFDLAYGGRDMVGSGNAGRSEAQTAFLPAGGGGEWDADAWKAAVNGFFHVKNWTDDSAKGYFGCLCHEMFGTALAPVQMKV